MTAFIFRTALLVGLVGLASLACTSAHGTDLQNLPLDAGAVLQTDIAGSALGRTVAFIGDINGDGIDDLAIGAPHDMVLGATGTAWVVFGVPGGLPATLDLTALDGSNGFALTSAATGIALGRAVTGIGDFNGDGIDDFAVSAPRGDVVPGYDNGTIYVVFGRNGPFPASVLLDALDGNDGFCVIGAEVDARAGFALAAAGDFNGDGRADLLIGSEGYANTELAHVLLGAASWPATLSLANAPAQQRAFRLEGPPASSAGHAVAGVGDVTGDGIDDVLVGAPNQVVNGNGNAGRVYLVPGRAASAGGMLIDLATATDVARLDGGAPGDTAGAALAGPGDINGDGYRDLLIGAPRHGGYVGAAWVVFGGPTLASGTLPDLTAAGAAFRLSLAAGYNTNVGAAVAGPGDINGDGIPDFMIAIPGGLPGAAVNHEVAVLFGRAANDPWPAEVDLAGPLVCLRLQGTSQIDLSAIGDLRGDISLAGGGDVNGDGGTDMLVGSALAADSGTPGMPWGRAWVVYGQPPDRIFADGFEAPPITDRIFADGFDPAP